MAIEKTPTDNRARIYYTGDMANAGGWFRADAGERSVTLTEEGGEGRVIHVRPSQIGHVYRGHCDPRFVTEAAYRAYRVARFPALVPVMVEDTRDLPAASPDAIAPGAWTDGTQVRFSDAELEDFGRAHMDAFDVAYERAVASGWAD